ncbi:hypothetical protein BCR34DRAFT_641370 [Clohesyomyces aquaticus]|uniref:Uncharacterized protein n=1 Tax=Clohesyomyces aquaticus TaxID=1231657 RepID=A0A1Y1YIW2_9PLEO|nr:hypothetical protein BCR34DRAFT_641370 [Clohesyomyces aquaticus]
MYPDKMYIIAVGLRPPDTGLVHSSNDATSSRSRTGSPALDSAPGPPLHGGMKPLQRPAPGGANSSCPRRFSSVERALGEARVKILRAFSTPRALSAQHSTNTAQEQWPAQRLVLQIQGPRLPHGELPDVAHPCLRRRKVSPSQHVVARSK